MKYFAYGSNMNWNDLDDWCRRHNYSPIDPGTNLEPGVAKGYKLIFNHWSKSRNGGALNLIRSMNDEVCGIVFTLSNKDFRKIKEKEGVAYRLYSINVVLAGKKVIGAKTFKAEDSRVLHPPTDEYLKIVLAGAECFNLGEKCLERIKKAAHESKGY